MSLNTVTTGNTILAADVNQLVNVLQRPSGSTEVGQYYLTGITPIAATALGAWVGSLSRGATPVSVTIDTAIVSPSNCNSPSTDHLSANGFHVFTAYTSANVAANVGGNYTIQY